MIQGIDIKIKISRDTLQIIELNGLTSRYLTPTKKQNCEL